MRAMEQVEIMEAIRMLKNESFPGEATLGDPDWLGHVHGRAFTSREIQDRAGRAWSPMADDVFLMHLRALEQEGLIMQYDDRWDWTVRGERYWD